MNPNSSPLIDFHVHPVLVREVLRDAPETLRNVQRVFGLRTSPQPLEKLRREMRLAGVEKAVLLGLDCETRWGCSLPSNEQVSRLVDSDRDLFIGFGSVDPSKGDQAVDELRHCVKELGLRGLKLDPGLQGFNPVDEKNFTLFAEAEKLGVPVLVHTGASWIPASILRLNDPLLWDYIAVRLPGLRIVLAHMGWPWPWQAATLAMKHPNVYLDLSGVYTGTPVEHLTFLLSEVLPRRVVERFLSEKLLFGSNFPRMEEEKMAAALASVPLDELCKQRIGYENAARLLGL